MQKMVEDEYREYGYRGLEELKQAQEKIAKLEKEIEHLKALSHFAETNKNE